MISCEEQLPEVRKKYHDKYIAFTNNKQLSSDHPFPKGTCLIVGDSILAGIDEHRLSTGKKKVQGRYFPGARTDDMYDYMKPLLRKYTGLHHSAQQMMLFTIHQGKSWIKFSR